VVRTRFAPSPTGDLHLGGAWTALASWTLARAAGGSTVLRVEDLDPPRVVAGAAARIAEDLAWLGLDWDESPQRGGPHAPYTQSERAALYDQRLGELEARGLTYPCDCSRAEIARAASAPHAGEELVYPGTCRDAPRDRAMRRAPAVRLRVAPGTTVAFVDGAQGRTEQRVDERVGDFVLRRGDGVHAYQLAVAVDDAAMRISHVVRADDLLSSTARQLLLMRLLGTPDDAAPSYLHLPMVVAADGERLAKRAGSVTVRQLRERGVSAQDLIGRLAHGLGLLGEERPLSARALAATLAGSPTWRRTPWPVPGGWA
jgi:glutamyl-tRNA synthetase